MTAQITAEQQKALQEKLKNMKPEEIQKMIQEQCIFCKILRGEIPTYTIYEDNKLLAFLDINPASEGHTLVIPKKHYSIFPQMSDSDISRLFRVARAISAGVFEATGAEGINIVQNNGAAAGQEIPHVYVHIIPRKQGDGITIPWKPKKISEEKLKELQTKIATQIKKQKITPEESNPSAISKVIKQPVIAEAAKSTERYVKPEYISKVAWERMLDSAEPIKPKWKRKIP